LTTQKESCTRLSIATVQVHIVDPTANTPPYDHALCTALAGAGAQVELHTSRFVHGPVPRPDGYRVRETFSRLSTRLGASAPRARRALRLAEHAPDMLRYRRRALGADVVHFQWVPLERLDRRLLPDRPLVLTVHNVDPRRLRLGLFRVGRELASRMDAIVVHSAHDAERLAGELGLPRERVHVIPHGAFDYLTRLPEERPLPEELAAVERPVVLFFGLVRPYKGVDVLLSAFAEVPDAELWVVGGGEVGLDPAPARELRRLAEQAPGRVRFVSHWVTDPEIPAYFRRADLVVLPFRQAAPSGVMHTALAFGKPLVLSRLGAFADIGERYGAARLVEPEDPHELAGAIRELLGDPERRGRMGEAAQRVAREELSWEAVGRRTLDLYAGLTR
jgi:glycosyltransferase involved in cell wall biosynthesis